jgi:tetratricopeptide (TPR) repeat protein
MTFRLSVALAGIFLAAFGLFATAPQTQPKANPIEAARLNNLGAAYMNQQLFEKGLKSFRQAGEFDPKLTIARLNEGIALLNLQKIDDAKAALEDALKQDPRNPNAWYNLGLLAKNTGEAQAAIDAFKHVTEIDPNDADTWYFLGSAYAQAKQFPQAIDAFQHALQLNPLHASAEFGLSRAYQQSADIDHAREHLKKFQYNRRADQPGLWRARKVFPRGGIAVGSIESARANQGAVCGCDGEGGNRDERKRHSRKQPGG